MPISNLNIQTTALTIKGVADAKSSLAKLGVEKFCNLTEGELTYLGFRVTPSENFYDRVNYLVEYNGEVYEINDIKEDYDFNFEINGVASDSEALSNNDECPYIISYRDPYVKNAEVSFYGFNNPRRARRFVSTFGKSANVLKTKTKK